MRWLLQRLRQDDGTVSAEYALVTVVACALAAVLFKVLTSAAVAAAIGRIVQSALGSLS